MTVLVPAGMSVGGELITTEPAAKSVPWSEAKRADAGSLLTEAAQLRLQMTMDRRSKFIETLSNIMKKIGTTQETLAQYLK